MTSTTGHASPPPAPHRPSWPKSISKRFARQRRRRRGGGASFGRTVEHVQLRRADGPRVRPGGAGGQLAVGGDGRRLRRAGRGACPRPRVPISIPLRPRPVRLPARGHVFVVVHRLDNLRRSGRIRKGASWLGTALSLKPLLCLDVDGRLVLDQRIRTVTKAHAAMVDRVAEVVGQRRGRDRGTPCRQPRRRGRDRRGIDDATASDRVAHRHRYGAGAVDPRRRRRGRRRRAGRRIVSHRST